VEVHAIEGESKPDIHPLPLALDDVSSFQHYLRASLSVLQPEKLDDSVDQFGETISSPYQVFPGADSHHLNFTGLIIAPDLNYPTGTIQDLNPDIWSSMIDARVLNSINITRTFLPLISRCQARILVLTPNIINSLNPARHAIESVSVDALEAFTRSLRRETQAFGVHVSQIKLGSIDFGPMSHLRALNNDQGPSEESVVKKPSSGKGSNPRVLHCTVFDALTMTRPFNTRRVGRGSVTYNLVGTLMPNSFIDWMLNTNRGVGYDISRSLEGWERVGKA
jgi:NAD(P)-dependent dehydrogenase (short-subunit alcohol dehydrogenase family)